MCPSIYVLLHYKGQAEYHFIMFLLCSRQSLYFSMHFIHDLLFELLCQARPARLGRAWCRCGPPVAPLLLPFGHLESSGVKLRKIVSFSNPENIWLPVIMKPKTAENRNWPLRHLVNRLVAGNQ